MRDASRWAAAPNCSNLPCCRACNQTLPQNEPAARLWTRRAARPRLFHKLSIPAPRRALPKHRQAARPAQGSNTSASHYAIGAMAAMFPITCCVMGGDDVDDEHQQPVWPPTSPPLTTTHGRLTLVRGYLKRKSTRNLEDGGPPRWALRWLEVDPPEEDRPEYMLSVYKTSARSKRLNAVSLKKISAVRHDDSLPCAFVVSVGESNYTLLARDAADCDTWVRSLNDAREALSVEPGAQCVAS